jgi:hypothetical protein
MKQSSDFKRAKINEIYCGRFSRMQLRGYLPISHEQNAGRGR